MITKRARKEKPDPICDACRERMKGNVPAHACEWCKEEQLLKDRRAWVTDIKLGSVLLGDMNELGKRVPDEAVDVICTDPPYIKELYEQAYADLAALACRVLKPYGFLFTYAPHAHLDEIMDLLRFSTDGRQKEGLRFFWIIVSINSGPSAKAHKWNALCLHKPILVFQKVPPGENIRGARRCFADVVRGKRQKRYHPWQQSVHDVLGIIGRFMDPGEILLDPFAGTGTSLIAGQLLGMDVVGFEMDPKTHAIAVREMQQRPVDLTGFGIEDTAPDCEREPVPVVKDQSRQAAIEISKVVKTRKITRLDPDHGPQEISKVCVECEAVDRCDILDPHGGCREEIPETPVEPDGCLICGHFKGRKTFLESCPRHNDLMFKGGQYSASRLMAETAIEGCSGMIPKTEKKSASRKSKKTKEEPES